ncbi:TetR/AcrR family transcriptional regulator [Streptomyces sp. SCSIO 30461]|uniref:TetR/AcrR family transcriptional regulator n=1 Tax=Streptomyces sp. SCSIO 30461 TaxID=3118085 RepID=UPI0030D5EEB3
MPRQPDLAKRRDLLDRIRAYVIRNGVSDLSLRPLGRAVGVSDRMLLYYFGSKERLITEVLARDEQRPLVRIRRLLESTGPPEDAAGMRKLMEEVWRQFTAPGVRAAFPLYVDVLAGSLLHPDRYGPVTRDVITQWTELLASALLGVGFPEERAKDHATLLIDATIGLLLAPLADGQWDRADRAYRALLDGLEPAWQSARNLPADT